MTVPSMHANDAFILNLIHILSFFLLTVNKSIEGDTAAVPVIQSELNFHLKVTKKLNYINGLLYYESRVTVICSVIVSFF